MAQHRPDDAAQAAELIAAAADRGTTLELRGGGSKRALGRPAQTDDVLDLSAFTGIVDYDPPELVLTARAATPLAQIEELLRDQRQMLAFEPPAWPQLLGGGNTATLGGVIACNLAGPRRVRAGAPRDHLLGFTAVNGFGEIWKAGGRVVKNVTGYDMCKLQCGAFGTLSALAELSVRVLPRPQTEATLLFPGLARDAAITLLADALNLPCDVSAAAWLPPYAAARSVLRAGRSLAAVRIEGHAPSVLDRRDRIAARAPGAAEALDAQTSAALWAEIAAVHSLLPTQNRLLWRLCPTPSAAARIAARIEALHGSAEFLFDWGGGLVWLTLDPAQAGADAAAGIIRGALQDEGGHATLIAAPAALRETVPVFEPASRLRAALEDRVKRGFDPRGVLNPGRMHKGR